MDGFLKLNVHKLRFAFIASSIIFLTFAFILLAMAYYDDQIPDMMLLTAILLTAGVGFPAFVLTVAYLEWLSKRKVRKRAFSQPPFDELDKIGFSKSYINDKTKWFFTEETKEVIINDFRIKCDITREDSHIISFQALTKLQPIGKTRLKVLKDKFNINDIIFDSEGISKTYNIKRPTALTIKQLYFDLEKFTNMLKQEQFEPEK